MSYNNNYVLLLLLLSLISCKVSDDTSASTESSNSNVADLSYDLDTNGCIINHNAEAEPSYLVNDKLAKNLVWNCTYFEISDDIHVEVFAPYNYIHQCYEAYYIIEDVGLCGTRASTPDAPILSTRIVEISGGIPSANGGGSFTIDYSATIENNGNVTAFNVRGKLYINDNLFTLMSLPGHLLPGQTVSVNESATLNARPGELSGDSYTLRAELQEYWGDVLLDVSSISVPIN